MKTFQLTFANRLSIKQNFLGFGQSADIDIVFDDIESRKLAEVKTEDGKKEKYLLYYDGETVSGKVSFNLLASYTQKTTFTIQFLPIIPIDSFVCVCVCV